jgi:Zn ribbon nucleic-acid-binding protein
VKSPQSVTFAVDGLAYQIDLNDHDANELRAGLSAFVGVARRVRHEPGHVRSGARATTDKDRNAAIRQWALDEGIELPGRGRIAGAVPAAHDAKDVAALWVERSFGYAVARAYAGHTSGENDATTTTYVRANIQEVAAALAALTGEPHPIAL